MLDQVFQFGEATTRVVVEADALARLGALIRDQIHSHTRIGSVLVVTDANVGPKYGAACVRAIQEGGFRVSEWIVPAGEEAKSLRVVENTYSTLVWRGLGRDALVVALGGGAVSDLAGFVAATWMRGVKLVLCPTTVEAAVDAAIGGKNAINLDGAKNIVGTFKQPEMVVVDPDTFRSLPARDVRAGLAESVKHALITSEEFLGWHEKSADALLQCDKRVMEDFVARNIRIKASFVERDVHDEKGIRVALNFGHTIGHAIEACCDYRLRHGECVALGMVAALEISRRRGLVHDALVARVVKLLEALGLPTRLTEQVAPARIIDAMQNDKKNKAGKLRFVLLDGIGTPKVHDNVSENEAMAAFAVLT